MMCLKSTISRILCAAILALPFGCSTAGEETTDNTSNFEETEGAREIKETRDPKHEHVASLTAARLVKKEDGLTIRAYEREGKSGQGLYLAVEMKKGEKPRVFHVLLRTDHRLRAITSPGPETLKIEGTYGEHAEAFEATIKYGVNAGKLSFNVERPSMVESVEEVTEPAKAFLGEVLGIESEGTSPPSRKPRLIARLVSTRSNDQETNSVRPFLTLTGLDKTPHPTRAFDLGLDVAKASGLEFSSSTELRFRVSEGASQTTTYSVKFSVKEGAPTDSITLVKGSQE